MPLTGASVARVYLVEGDLSPRDVSALGERLLADPVTESASPGATDAGDAQVIEVHPLPGVMDPVAQSVRDTIREVTGAANDVLVSTGWRYDFRGLEPAQAEDLARRLLANPVVHRIHRGAYLPDRLPRGHEYRFALRHIPIRDLTDDALTRLSREAHLFLSLDEMKAIQAEFRRVGREPTDIELETLAQTWSEHCVHKTLKSRVVYRERRDEETERRSDEETDRGTDRQGGSDRAGVSFVFTPRGRAGEGLIRTESSPLHLRRRDIPELFVWAERPGHTLNADGSVTIDNLLKSTVAAATRELVNEGVDWTLSVFKDNSGVIAFDDDTAVCIKVETHNHPSAIEPYGGAATGIGGCIRDVIGTGLGARPIASTDVFCVAFPQGWEDSNAKVAKNAKETGINGDASADVSSKPLPPGCIHPRRILTDVVAGIRDYGNRMGIPTVSGGAFFDDRYVGNPLVFAGCVGVMPRDRVEGRAHEGDRIVALGGRTGRDGIHGATFSSAELEQSSSDEFSHAVQIGNAIEEKRLLDAILRARDEAQEPLFHAITDCGAGGFSSAVGEMGKDLGALVHLDRAPLKYSGLSYTEIWISEAQERMILAVPPENLAALLRICGEEAVELADLGHFGTEDRALILQYHAQEVGRLDMHFLHDGLPQPTREAVWGGRDEETKRPRDEETPASQRPQDAGLRTQDSSLRLSVSSSLLSLLSHPTIASKHWIIRQYDHEVQGNTILKPFVGPGGRGPGDAAVIEPVPGTGRGLAIACGMQTPVGDPAIGGDPYQMTLAAIDECVRNLVCAGADPRRIAILDNFCWPSCAKPDNLGSLVRAAEGCYDGAKAYRTPFVSGKDSLNNQLKYTDPATGRETVVEIPPTLLITGMGIVPSIARCVTMDAKRPGNILVLIGETTDELGASLYAAQGSGVGSQESAAGGVGLRPVLPIPRVDLARGPRTAQAVAEIIRQGLAAAAHDCSEGGLLVAVAEMLIATTREIDAASLLAGRPAPPLGADLTLDPSTLALEELAFAENPSRYVLEIRREDYPRVRQILTDHGGIRAETIGAVTDRGRLAWPHADLDLGVSELADAWLRPLDW